MERIQKQTNISSRSRSNYSEQIPLELQIISRIWRVRINAVFCSKLFLNHALKTKRKKGRYPGLGGNMSMSSSEWQLSALTTTNIVKILNLYISLLCTPLYHFFPVSLHSLQCIHCLLQLCPTILLSLTCNFSNTFTHTFAITRVWTLRPGLF